MMKNVTQVVIMDSTFTDSLEIIIGRYFNGYSKRINTIVATVFLIIMIMNT